jgi:hypothetical protein
MTPARAGPRSPKRGSTPTSPTGRHRSEAALDLAVALVITVKLVTWHHLHGATIYQPSPAS